MHDKKDNRVSWQIKCDDAIKDKCNVILSSPTGSGKTGRYELWALNKPQRPIFITSPIKSLSNQKFRKLQSCGYKVGLETGDITYIPYDDCDIICCTQEIYNNKYRNYRNSTLIIDEFSYIFEEDRARAYVDSLYYSQAENIMICSATFGNSEEIKEYISKVTNRDFFLYENKERLTTLQYKGEIEKENINNSLVVAYSKNRCKAIAKRIYFDRINRIQQILNTSSYIHYDQKRRKRKEVLDIAHKFNIDNEELIDLCTMGIAYYYGALYPKEKLFVEELFEKKLIDTVVGTDALAFGVNFPIKNVVFTQLCKSKHCSDGQQTREYVSKNLFDQLSGRAGRKGYFDVGYVYYCSDFESSYGDNVDKNLGNDDLKNLFSRLVTAKNENAKISLTPNIKDILNSFRTEEEEANFIVEYSTVTKNLEDEKKKIREIIYYIKNFDAIRYCLNKKFSNFNFEQGYYKAIENCTQKFKDKFEKILNDLNPLQSCFDRDIGEAYFPEYTHEQNCTIFVDVLMKMSIKELMKKYVKDLHDMLLLRKYILKLPEKYSSNYDISEIDEIIDAMDHTILHAFVLDLEKEHIGEKNTHINKK